MHQWTPGESVADILSAVQPDESMWNGAHVFLGDIEVRREYFHVVRPRPDVLITIKVMPEGGDVLRAVAFIGLAAASFFTFGAAGGGLWGAAASAAVSVAGSLAINALIPPDVPELDNGIFAGPGQSLSVGGARNRLDPFGNEPLVLGYHYIVPPYAARPYTELQGDDQYVVMLFTLGQKPLEVNRSHIRIGNTQVTDYDDVEVEVLTGGSDDDAGITLYNNIVLEDVVNKQIPASGYAQHTTAADVDSVIYEIHFPVGLIKLLPSGDKLKRTVVVTAQYTDATVSPESWQSLGTHTFTADTATAIRRGFVWTPPSNGQYTIRMTADVDNFTGAPGEGSQYNDRYFAILRSRKHESAVNDSNVAQVAIRIKATKQLSGIPDTVGMYVQSIVPDYGSSPQWDGAITNNPASLLRHVLTGLPNARALSTTRLHTQSFIDFWNFCDTEGFTFNRVIDSNQTIQKTINEICRVAYSRVQQVDGLWRVMTDEAQTTPLQIFTPRNTWGFSAAKAFPIAVHGFRVRFIDETQTPTTAPYQNDEIVVYDDGYNSGNATVFESLEAVGITNWDNVWRYARRYLSISRLQTETFTFNVDAEHLVTIVGDRADMVEDSILVGLGAARVKAITADDVTLDAEMPGDGVASYSVQFRRTDNTTEIVAVDTFSGSQATLDFSSTQGSPLPAEVGDLCIFGESGSVSFPMLIRNIEPTSDLSAKLTCIPYNASVYTSDTGLIPAYNPVITNPPGAGTPVFTSINSDEYVMWRDAAGTLQPRMLVTLGFLSERRDVQAIIVQYREYNDVADDIVPWISMPILPGDAQNFYIIEVNEGDDIEVRARYVFENGDSSAWTDYMDSTVSPTTPYHTVVGKSTQPPALDNFTVVAQADGTREYTWSFNPGTGTPPDIAGYEIRYYDTDDAGSPLVAPDWDDMTALNTGLITNSPFEFNAPFQGDWWFSVKAVDTGGLYSEAQLQTPIITLPLPRLGDSLFYLDHFSNGWLDGQDPGAGFTLCEVNPSTDYLIGASTQTWGSSASPASSATWATADTWAGPPPTTGVEYAHTVGTGSPVVFAIAFDDTVTSMRVTTTIMADSGGTYTYEYNLNNTGWTAGSPEYDANALQALTFSNVDTIGFKLKVDNIPATGVQNWVLQGFAA